MNAANSTAVLDTSRLLLRRLTEEDAPFILGLLNEPSFIEFIGDRGVRTVDDARRYLLSGPMASYEQHGFGLYLVELRDRSIPIGICGLLKREQLEHPDIGFSLLPRYWSQGYALEAASAVMEYARQPLALGRLLAITSQHNARSAHLLGKLGFTFERNIRISPEGEELKLFGAG
jgi:RimJ/RimL family protein N-acetyltransferase